MEEIPQLIGQRLTLLFLKTGLVEGQLQFFHLNLENRRKARKRKILEK